MVIKQFLLVVLFLLFSGCTETPETINTVDGFDAPITKDIKLHFKTSALDIRSSRISVSPERFNFEWYMIHKTADQPMEFPGIGVEFVFHKEF